MASALRKLFRQRRRKNNPKDVLDSPSHIRFFGRCSSPRRMKRDSNKVRPEEILSPPADAFQDADPSEWMPASPSRRSKSSPQAALKHVQSVRTRRLMKEYQEITRLARSCAHPPFAVELVDDNLYEWSVKLFQIDPESELFQDLQGGHVLISLAFPENFPFAPPFVRVVAPRLEKGFVMEGGAVCMELLTPRGWASAYTVEAVLVQLAASLAKGQARLARKGKRFNRKAAEASFRSLVKTHDKYGWVTPPLADG